MLAIHGKKFLVVISVLVIALNLLRCPELLLYPRFFAEEGATYFACAFQQSFLANIFSAHFGYYTLYNQLATSCATLAPLEHAPLVTTLMSLLVQIGISLYVLWGEFPLLDTLWRRTALALAIPLISWPGHWLTIIGSQCWFGAGTFLLLLSADGRGNPYRYAARSGYLLIAGLTGVISGFMVPAYLWRAYRQRSREFFAYAALLIFCLLIHTGVLLTALQTRSPELTGRFVANSFTTMLGKTVVYQFAVPFTGRGFYERQSLVDFGAGIKATVENIFSIRLLIHDLFMVPVLIGVTVFVLTAVIIWQNRTRLEVQLITLALLVVSILSNLCSTSSAGGPRYYFIPSLILLTLYIGIKELKSYRPIVAAAGLLVLSTLMANGYEYRSIMTRQAYRADYPDWRRELALWKKIPAYQINIWPADWKMNLDKQFTPS